MRFKFRLKKYPVGWTIIEKNLVIFYCEDILMIFLVRGEAALVVETSDGQPSADKVKRPR